MKIEKKVGRHSIVLDASTIGKDLLVVIHGGDEHHIGAVSIAYPTKSPNRGEITVSLNSITIPGHKDYLVANSAAEKICNALGVVTTVVAGIHMDKASRSEIDGAVKTADMMVDEMISLHKKSA
jgi:hypothetical protein